MTGGMDALKTELKQLIIATLNLSDVTVDAIGDDDPLFGEGLGLDSLDALELVVELEARYATGRDLEGEEARAVFETINNLSRFIATFRTK